MATKELVQVSAAEFQKDPGTYRDMAKVTPVAITENGREQAVLLSAEEYHRLKRRDREVLGLGDFTAEEIAEIEASTVDPKYGYLNEELKDWQP